MSNSVNFLNYVPLKYRNSQILLDFFAAAGNSLTAMTPTELASVGASGETDELLYNVGYWLDLIDDVEEFFDPIIAPTEYLKYLAALIGLKLLPADSTTESILRASISEAIDWYKIKGTYTSLNVIGLINGVSFNIWDFYTKDYITFGKSAWFVGGENENPSEYPYSEGYYKTPHFGLEVPLDKVYVPDTTIPVTYNHLWHYSYWDNIKEWVEKTRPVHTVPHYIIFLNPETVENGTVVTVDGNIQTLSTLNWISGLRYFDQNSEYDSSTGEYNADWTFDEKDSSGVTDITFDETSGITVEGIDKWRLATGNKNSSLEIDTTLLAQWKLNDFADTTTVVDYTSKGHTGTSIQNTNVMHALLGHWAMNETSGTTVTDSSGRGNNGTSVATIVSDPAGKVGTAIVFDGSNDYISMGDQDEWDFGTEDFAICAWVKFDSLSGSQSIISFNDKPDTYWALLKDENNLLQLVFRSEGELKGSYYYPVDFMAVDNWYHICIGRKGATAFLYINGTSYTMYENKAFGLNNLTLATDSPALIIGATYYPVSPTGPPPQLSNLFNGSIDDVRLYGVSLSSTDAEFLYNSGGGTALPLPEGKIGNALTFNGTTDFIDCGDVTSIEGISTFTISSWFYPTTSTTGTIAGKHNLFLLKKLASGKTQFGVYNEGVLKNWSYSISVDDVLLNAWNLVVCTYDGTYLKTYLNGVYQGATAHQYGGNTYASTDSFQIGSILSSSLFTGKIDDVRVYNRVLTEVQALELYNITSTSDLYSSTYAEYVKPTGFWKMDDESASDTVVTDYSGNNKNGSAQQVTEDISITGKVGNALSFNGTSDYITIADDTLFDFGTTTDFSISMWFKTSGSTDDNYLFHKGDGTNTIEFYVRDDPDASGMPGELTATIKSGGTQKDIHSGIQVNDGIWHNVVLVADRDGYLTLYIDNVVCGIPVDISSVGDLDTSTAIYLGCKSGSSNFFFGDIDDVRIYSEAISTNFVEYLYNNNLGVYEYTGSLTSDNITVYPDKVEIEFTVPKATILSGVSEMNMFTDGDTSGEEEVVTCLYPDIYKSTNSELRILTIINRE